MTIQLGAKIHAMTQNAREVGTEVEVAQTKPPQGPRLKIGQHVDVARLGIKVMAEHRPQKRQAADPPLRTEVRHRAAIHFDGQVSDAQRTNLRLRATEGKKLQAPQAPQSCSIATSGRRDQETSPAGRFSAFRQESRLELDEWPVCFR
jgi:hypothetical protein